jgi:murein DD-endopeptidase MepM/ murein hydrolase activator NlpD
MLEGAIEPAQRAGSQRLWLPPHLQPCASCSRVSRPSSPWLEPIRFDYRVCEDELALVYLLGDLDAALGPPNAASLLVRHPSVRTRFPASEGETRPGRSPLWQVSFEVPLEVVESPQALFSLEAPDRIPIAMPAPGLRPDVTSVIARRPNRPFRLLIRRSAAVLAAGVAFAAIYGSCAGVAGADSSSPRTQPSKICASATTKASIGTTSSSSQWWPCPTPTKPSPPPSGRSRIQPKKTKKSNWDSEKTDKQSKPAAGGARPRLHERWTPQHRRSRRRARDLHPSGGAAIAPPPSSPAHPTPHNAGNTSSPAAAALPATPRTAGPAISPFTAAQIERFSAVSSNLDQPPAFLIPIYRAAGRRYHIPWQILAAINAIETDYGTDLSTSAAGAIGWMQFMPGTWARFGVNDAGGSHPNPYDPRDAIFSAARYLAANGGSGDIRRALFTYNHAAWYVDEVLWRAQLISDRAVGRGSASAYGLPLDPIYMRQLGRTDDGVDIEDAPDGAAVYSMTPGVVTAVASNPSGFGPNYPVVLVTAGPLAGQYIYYGHVAASLVRVGQHVLAGQPIAIMGHTGDAAGLRHGHIEIGFSDASGDPLNHHGGIAWTPSGAAMRTVLVALTHRLASPPNRPVEGGTNEP